MAGLGLVRRGPVGQARQAGLGEAWYGGSVMVRQAWLVVARSIGLGSGAAGELRLGESR